MSGKPAARLSDPTTCPLPGHGENPIASGSPDVVFDSLPAARKGDVTTCGSVITSNVSSTVFINGMPAAFLGSVGDHGGVIIGGSGTVIIGDMVAFEAFSPIELPKSYAQAFVITDSETGQLLINRDFIALVDGRQVSGVTDSKGLAHIQAPSADSIISLHVLFKSPARILTELSESIQ